MSSDPVAHLRLTAVPWKGDERLRNVMAVIADAGDEVRIVGGAVRDALLKRPIKDIDLATTATPDLVAARAEAAGFRAVPTGIAHGTVTIVAAGKPFEVTTLREDVATNGRHATVTFGRDWAKDAGRRDFTINALYADVDGLVTDYVGGIADCLARRLRFIGLADARIREDYLRILRFYRFCAVIDVATFDEEAVAATVALASGIDSLSGERIGQEMLKLVVADGALTALEAMRANGILSRSLGVPVVDLAPFARVKSRLASLHVEALAAPAAVAPLLLGALVATQDDALALARRLRLSNAVRDRIVAAFQARAQIERRPDDRAVPGHLYRLGAEAFSDAVLLTNGDDAEALRRIGTAHAFVPPRMPVTGRDLLAAGIAPGPEVGAALERLTERWIDSGFSLSREDLLADLR